MPDPIKYIQLDSSSEKNSKPYSRLFFKVSMKPSEITVRLLKSPAYHEFSFLSPSGWILNDFVVFCNIFFFKIIRILLRKFIYLDVACMFLYNTDTGKTNGLSICLLEAKKKRILSGIQFRLRFLLTYKNI